MRLWTAEVEDLSESEASYKLFHFKEHEVPVSTSIFNMLLLTSTVTIRKVYLRL